MLCVIFSRKTYKTECGPTNLLHMRLDSTNNSS
jgi:hypothetical protein